MKSTLLICFIIVSIATYAQKPEVKLDVPYMKGLKKHHMMKDSANLYVYENDTEELFYYALVPTTPVKGLLILLPGTWELAEDVLNNNKKLVALGYDQGIITIVPSLNYNLCMNEAALRFLNATFIDAFEKYHPSKNKVVIGGYSLGGMNAIRYTEIAYQDSSKTFFKPAAVYGVDPPLDLAGLYHTFSGAVKKNMSEASVGEAASYLERMDAQFGGSPEKFPENYIRYSMYSRGQSEGGNAKYLRSVAIRIYSDPDIDWYLKNRRVDLYDMNALNQTAMINDLHGMGNERAEFVNALGKGIRPNGMRHPHSWSIAEPVECFNWIMKCLN